MAFKKMISLWCMYVLLLLLVTGEELDPNHNGNCVFPFTYNGKSYSKCTTAGRSDGKLWCSLTCNYNADQEWKFCDTSEPVPSHDGPCVFPFMYNGKSYSSCTTAGESNGRPWCSLTSNYNADHKWKYCSPSETDPKYDGPCVFPFTYNGKSYSSCTTVGESNGRPWCSLTSNYNADHKRKYCSPSETVPNHDGPCVFPFKYNGKSYSSCTTAGESNGRPWCSLTSNYNADHKWKYCSPSEPDPKYDGPCVFPFTYNGKSYSSCTTVGESNGRPWCSLTSNYNADHKWKYCSPSEPVPNHVGPCVFPFTYNGKSYSSCTTAGESNGRPWCSLTSNYNADHKWKYCSPSETDPKYDGPCVFPFTYNGKSYSSCTTVGESNGRPWCSLTSNYNADHKWKYCTPSEPDPKDDGPCVFPFTYNGKSYSSCTTAGESNGRPWCSLTSNYNADHKWKYCSSSCRKIAGKAGSKKAEPDQNQNGHCVFPFTYNGKSYSSCTTAGESNGKLWCSLTSNYNEDHKWKYCNPLCKKIKEIEEKRLGSKIL